MSYTNFIRINSGDSVSGKNLNNKTYQLHQIKELKKDYDVEIGVYSFHINNTSINIDDTTNSMRIREIRVVGGAPVAIIFTVTLTVGIYNITQFALMIQNALNNESTASGYALNYIVSGEYSTGRLRIENTNLNNTREFQFLLTDPLFTAYAELGFDNTTDLPTPAGNLLFSTYRMFFAVHKRIAIKSNIINMNNYSTFSGNTDNIIVSNIQFQNEITGTTSNSLDYYDFYNPNIIFMKASTINMSSIYIKIIECCDNMAGDTLYSFRNNMSYSLVLVYRYIMKEDIYKQKVLMNITDIKNIVKKEQELKDLKDELKEMKKDKKKIKK